MIYTLPAKLASETIKGVWLDFKNRLQDGETISSKTVTASDATVLQNVQISGTRITWDAVGGTPGTTVIFTITVTGSLGSVRSAEAVMLIEVAQS